MVSSRSFGNDHLIDRLAAGIAGAAGRISTDSLRSRPALFYPSIRARPVARQLASPEHSRGSGGSGEPIKAFCKVRTPARSGVGWGTGAPGIGVDPVWWTLFSRSTSPIGDVLAAVK
jgi:hypothetical protein